MALSYPLVNGLRYDHSSAEINVNGTVILGIKEISFSDELEPGEVYGTYAQSVGVTRGQYKAEGSMSMFFEEAQQLMATLGGSERKGFMEKQFQVVINYKEENGDLVTVELKGVRIKKAETSHSSGSDPIETKFDLRVGMVVRNGIYPMNKVLK